MAGHSEDDGGDAKQKVQPFGELYPRILEIQPLSLAVSEHAFDEPSPAVVPQDAFATQRLGAGYDQ